MLEKKRTFYNIDFLRFLFTIAILLLHASGEHHSGQFIATKYFGDPGYSVDLFFILAGFFLINEKKDEPLGTFVIKKWVRLAPVCLFSLVLHVICFYSGIILQSPHFKHELLNLLFIRELGLNGFGLIPLENNIWATNTHCWYLGPLFWVSLFYKYIGSKLKKTTFSFATVLIAFFSTVSYFHNLYPPFHGLFRAFSGISCGILLKLFLSAPPPYKCIYKIYI